MNTKKRTVANRFSLCRKMTEAFLFPPNFKSGKM
nr:MAG TPA: hypothetical protein [Caudoviricetes sp.]